MVDDKNLSNAVSDDTDNDAAVLSAGAEENLRENEPDEADTVDEEDYSDEDLLAERERIQEERRRKKRRKKGHGRFIFALILVTVIVSAAILLAAMILSSAKEILGLGRSDVELSVEVEENSSTEDIATLLEDEGVIGNATMFRIISKLQGADGTYMAGSHKLIPSMTYSEIIETLQEQPIDDREFVNVTFQEGITLIEAAEKLEEAGVCSADDFITTFNSSSFGFDFEKEVTVTKYKFYKMEGYCFPDTYTFYLDEDPQNVVKKIYRNFEYKFTPDYRQRMEDLDMTLEEVIILASMVQAEASYSTDMKLVASVFLNRLNNPEEYPLLQSDPTTNYVEDVIKPNIVIASEEMYIAYDTYQGAGLPPGAICNPGTDAIEAVLYPRETNYYYFCSNLETGEMFYAETLEEHEANLVEAGLTS